MTTERTGQGVDLVVSFDTTGSMYPCITQLRRKVEEAIRKLFQEIPNLRVGIIAHGDYCDAGRPYVTKILDLTDNEDIICNFVRRVESTGGGDAPECYELVLHQARSLQWTAGRAKALVLIGDDVPHGPNYRLNTQKLNWRNELDCLQEMDVSVYGVQALNRSHATSFYEEIAHKTGGFHLTLDQFSYVTEMVLAIAYRQDGVEPLQAYEEELEESGRMNRNLDRAIGTMLGRETGMSERFESADDLNAVSPGRFQVLEVDRDTPIKNFVLENGALFRVGRGFYEFTKRVLVQHHKEVVLMDNRSGDLFSGEKAREMLGLPETGTGENIRISPSALPGFTAFIQSTSANRKLLNGTKFLYEVEDYAR